MKLVLVLLGLLAVAKCTVPDGCEREDVDRCTNIIIDQLTSGNSQLCGALREARTCIGDFIDRCMSDAARNRSNIQHHLDDLNQRVERTCVNEEVNGTRHYLDDVDTSGYTDEEREMLGCVADVQKITTYVVECHELNSDEIRNGGVQHHSTIADARCRSYMSISRCVSEKVGNACGESIKEPYYHEMMLGVKNQDPRSAASPECANAIRLAEEFMNNDGNTRKRRSVENIRFFKLIP